MYVVLNLYLADAGIVTFWLKYKFQFKMVYQKQPKHWDGFSAKNLFSTASSCCFSIVLLLLLLLLTSTTQSVVVTILSLQAYSAGHRPIRLYTTTLLQLSLWLLFRIFIQKVFETNLNFKSQQVINQKKKGLYWCINF